MRRAHAMLLALLVWASAWASACVPDYEARPSLVTEEVVLAVQGEPPEAEPGSEVAFALLAAGPDGTLADPPARWTFCLDPKPVAETGAVSEACVEGGGDAFGNGGATTAALPEEGCALHGPDTPPGDFRPRDADATGGFYQPVGVELGDRIAFGGERLRCELRNAAVDLAREYRDRYVSNRNPSVPALTAPAEARAGDEIDLAIAWPAEDAEDYVYYDPSARDVVTRREAMSVSWFATAGSFASDRTGRAEDDGASTSENRWTAPDAAGTVHLWVVLRDSRGGVAWTDATLDVAP